MNRRNRNPEFQNRVFYGQLLNMYEIPLPADAALGLTAPVTWILARIKPCPITPGNIPGTISYIPQRHDAAPIEVIDVALISAVVGRMEYDGRVYIIDRTNGEADPTIPDT